MRNLLTFLYGVFSLELTQFGIYDVIRDPRRLQLLCVIYRYAYLLRILRVSSSKVLIRKMNTYFRVWNELKNKFGPYNLFLNFNRL